MVLKVIESTEKEYFLDCFVEFHSAISRANPELHFVKSRYLNVWRQVVRLIRVVNKAITLRLPSRSSDTVFFSIQMGPDFAKCMPFCLGTKNNYIYMYDAWPQYHDWMVVFLKTFPVKGVFFSSKQVTDYFKERGIGNVYWIPEGIAASDYAFKDYDKKDIDVIEFGRRYEFYHQRIKDTLSRNNRRHIYVLPGMKILFDSKGGLVEALSRSKISICIPSNITHPERSGNICTMTLRYLQSMASRCLLVGMAPPEMIELFGYNPVIEIDLENAAQQILDILDNYQEYIPLIEKNYKAVICYHTWDNRWSEISDIINKN